LRQPEPWLSLVSLGFMTRPALTAIPLWNRLPVLLRAIVLAELIADIGGLMPDLFMVANLKFSPSGLGRRPNLAVETCVLVLSQAGFGFGRCSRVASQWSVL